VIVFLNTSITNERKKKKKNAKLKKQEKCANREEKEKDSSPFNGEIKIQT